MNVFAVHRATPHQPLGARHGPPAAGDGLLAPLTVPRATLNALAAEIAILKSSSISAYDQAITGFKSTAPSGAIYSEYDAQGDLEQGRKLAKKIRASEASLVVAVGLKAALAAKLEIVDIPIVYMMILDPSKHNLTAPNMTGTLLEIPAERQFKILRAFLPDLRRLGMLSKTGINPAKLKDTIAQAAAHSFQLQDFPVESEKGVPQQLRSLLASTDALLLVPDSTVLTNESVGFILETSLARRVPVIGFSPEFTRLGALLSLSVSYGEVGRETGVLAKRILDGDRKLPAKAHSDRTAEDHRQSQDGAVSRHRVSQRCESLD